MREDEWLVSWEHRSLPPKQARHCSTYISLFVFRHRTNNLDLIMMTFLSKQESFTTHILYEYIHPSIHHTSACMCVLCPLYVTQHYLVPNSFFFFRTTVTLSTRLVLVLLHEQTSFRVSCTSHYANPLFDVRGEERHFWCKARSVESHKL